MIIIIDLGKENTASIQQALDELSIEYKVTSSEYEICRANNVILCGYGEASAGLKKLHLMNLFTVMRIIKRPLLGIGLGMQLMSTYSSEGNVSCLGIFPGSTEKFAVSDKRHSGMFPIHTQSESKILSGIRSDDKFYFDHSYYLPVAENTTSVSEFGINFSASMEKDKSFGVQFHPEKSGEAGLLILKNFLSIK